MAGKQNKRWIEGIKDGVVTAKVLNWAGEEFTVLFDAVDLPTWAARSWAVRDNGQGRYYLAREARCPSTRKRGAVYFHRTIMACPEDLVVDHINGNGLDNRRCNMRLASQGQNMANSRIYSTNTSGVTGVSLDKSSGKWRAYLRLNGKQVNFGSFLTKDEAARARRAGEKAYFGSFAAIYGCRKEAA